MPFADSNGVAIHYQVVGEGPPLLLHHGFTGSHRDWETFGFTGPLSERYRLILPDMRGHGASDKPHDPDQYGFRFAVRDVLAVLDDLELEQAHYYGYSFGGIVGWALGTLAPERFASLAIGGATPYPVSSDVLERAGEMREHLEHGMEGYVAWRESRTGPWPAGFRERALRNDPRALIAAISPKRENPELQGFNDQLDRMTMPVLVITGDDDERFAGSLARRAAGELADATFIEIPSANHFKLYVRGGLVMPCLIDFLERVAAPA